MLNSMPGLHPLDASSIPPVVMIALPPYMLISLGRGAELTLVENHWSTPYSILSTGSRVFLFNQMAIQIISS